MKLRHVVIAALAGCGSVEAPPELPAVLPQETTAVASGAASSLKPKPPPSPKDIDLTRAKEPAQVWSYPTDGGEPLLVAGVVVVQDAEGESISAVAPATGKPAWKLAAPPGVTFSELKKGRDAIYVGGFSDPGGTLTRVDPKTGKVVWHIQGPSDVRLGHDGTGGVVAANGCQSNVINLANGRIASTPFKDALMTIHPLEPGGNLFTQCQRATWPLLERNGVTLISQGKWRDEKLLGVNALGATSYSIPIDGAHARVAFIDGDEVVLLLLGRNMETMRVNVVSGGVRFRSKIADETACEKDRGGYYAEAVPGAKGKGNGQLFVRGCGRAALVDMGTGASSWVAEIGGDAAFLTGVETIPWESPASLELSSAEPTSARFFSLAGKVEKTIELPESVREVMPVAGGVVATNLGLDVTAYYDETGLRWRVPLAFGNSFLLGQRFLVLGSEAAAQVVIEPRTGSAFVVGGCGSAKCTSGSPYAVGQIGDLWLTTRSDPDELFAVRPSP